MIIVNFLMVAFPMEIGKSIRLTFGEVPLPQPVIHPAALDELHEVVLRHAGRHVPPAVDGEVGAPRQREIEPDEGGLLVPELGIPELVRGDGGRVQGVELALLQDGQRRPLGLRLAALLRRLQRAVLGGGARVLRRAGGQRLCGQKGRRFRSGEFMGSGRGTK